MRMYDIETSWLATPLLEAYIRQETQKLEAYEAEAGGRRLHILFLPEAGRAGICRAHPEAPGMVWWGEASSAQDALENWLTASVGAL